VSDEPRDPKATLWLTFGIVGAVLAAIELFALILLIVFGSPESWKTLLILVGFVLLTLASTYFFRRWARGRAQRDHAAA
jgi:carbon starvation protein CstA